MSVPRIFCIDGQQRRAPEEGYVEGTVETGPAADTVSFPRPNHSPRRVPCSWMSGASCLHYYAVGTAQRRGMNLTFIDYQ